MLLLLLLALAHGAVPRARVDGMHTVLDDRDGLGGGRLVGDKALDGVSRHLQPVFAHHPGVLRAAALAGVDDELARGEGDAGQPAGQHPDILAVVDGERPEVGVPRPHALLDERGDGRQLHDRLRDPAARVGEQSLAERFEFVFARGGADDEPLAAGAVHRLHDQLVEPVEHLFEGGGVFEPPGVDVPDDRLLAQVVPDEVGHVGVDQLVVRDPVADRIGDGDVAEAGGEQQAGTAEHRVGTELQRVEELVVHAAIDDVHPGGSGRGAHPDAATRTEQVAPLDQLDAHEASEQGVLEVGGVVDAGGEHHDGRVFDAVGCARAQGLQQFVRVVADRAHSHGDEELGEGLRHHAPVRDDIAHAARHAHVVFEHPPAALLVPDQVDARDLDAHAVGRHDAGRLAVEVAG